MLVAFRCDASVETGAGHVMRCLTLAQSLVALGADCRFITRAMPIGLIEKIQSAGCDLISLDKRGQPLAFSEAVSCTSREIDAQQTRAVLQEWGIDWLVVDHYCLDQQWERAQRSVSPKILVIDDLANRVHDCDVILDQNLGRSADDYREKVPAHCHVLIGPQFALLRPEFAALREATLRRRERPTLKRILVTMGGSDAHNATGAVLEALSACNLPQDVHLAVVVGSLSPWQASIQTQVGSIPYTATVVTDVTNMALQMANADICIGAGGISSWERCCLGLPSLVVTLAENQKSSIHALAEIGAAFSIGDISSISENLPRAIDRIASPAQLLSMISAASSVVDGLGASRLSERLV